jgi:hypothetical protein
MLERLDAQELDQCLTTWLGSTTPLASGEGIGVDGKTVQGVPGGLHLLATYAHQTQVVLAQEAVDHKENEIKAAPRVLQTLQLQDRVVTGDAMLAQRSLSRQVVAAGGDYFWVVKDNHLPLEPTSPYCSLSRPLEKYLTTLRTGAGTVDERKCDAGGPLLL